MKKHIFLSATLLLSALTLFNGCGKEPEPVTIPDTILENAGEITDPPLTETEVIEPIQPDNTNDASSEQTPPEDSVSHEAFWDQIYDYSQDQPSLTSDGDIKNLTIQLGNTANELFITWFSKSGSRGHVNFKNTSTGEQLSAKVSTQGSISVPNYFRNRAVITGIEADTSYEYQVGNGNTSSPTYTYESGNPESDEFTFTIVSDQEIGLGDLEDNVYDIHSTEWRLGLNRMKEQIPESEFIFSLGDHIARKDSTIEYDLFLDQSVLYSTPLIPVVGNHDAGSGFFGDHFQLPNMSPYGHSNGDDGDYWFVYGNTLFMVLNTNAACLMDDHEMLILDALEKNPDVKWRVLVSHHSPVSNVERYQGSADSLRIYFDYAELYDIDLVLGGHDHVYTRSYLMAHREYFLSTASENEFRNPRDPHAAVYMVFSSATSSLYRQPDNYPWAAVSIQTEHPQISKAHVTENSFTITTYEADTWKQLDTFTIYKD